MVTKLPVTAVIINFRTADLTRRAVTSFRAYYPAVPLLLIDNGSRDESTAIVEQFARESPDTTKVIVNDQNLHHGPAMDQALQFVDSSYVLFLDSDCEVLKTGFLESMIEALEAHPEMYVIGKRVFMNKRGFDVPEGKNAFPYIRPICMLIKRELYLFLPKFERHGTPCLRNMIEAVKQDFRLLDFPIEEFIVHRGRGTAGLHGYNLGWRGKLNYILNKLGL